jgi:hypothetical protein
MSGTLQHMKQTETRFAASVYSALNSASVVSLVVVLVLMLFFVFVAR